MLLKDFYLRSTYTAFSRYSVPIGKKENVILKEIKEEILDEFYESEQAKCNDTPSSDLDTSQDKPLKIKIEDEPTAGTSADTSTKNVKKPIKRKKTSKEHVGHVKTGKYTEDCKFCKIKIDAAVKSCAQENSDNKVKYHCNMCTKIYAKIKSFTEHLKKHWLKPDQRPVYDCKYCVAYYTRKPLLTRHVKRWHCSAIILESFINTRRSLGYAQN